MTEVAPARNGHHAANEVGDYNEDAQLANGRVESTNSEDYSTSRLKALSPRCEAFTMTGDKIIRYDSKVSPNFAQVRGAQLPPGTMVRNGNESPKRGPFDDFPSMQHRVSSHRLRRMQQQEPISERAQAPSAECLPRGEQSVDVDQNDADTSARQQPRQSNVTVNALCNDETSRSTLTAVSPTDANYRSLNMHNRDKQLDTHNEFNSAPNSPAKYAQRALDQTPRSPQQPSTPHNPIDATEAARRLATRLYTFDGFRPSDIVHHLNKDNDFASSVAREYVALFNFGGLRIDAALRRFLAHFCLLGESQERERVMRHFAARYNECNPALFNSEDEIHTLACALLLLNNDQHGDIVSNKMTCKEFIDNLAQTGIEFKRDLLKALFNSIKDVPIEFASDAKVSALATASTSKTAALPRSVSSTGKDALKEGRSDETHPENQVEYKNGWVMRKSVRTEHGKKTPFGRRSWRMFYATLRGLMLFLHKDDNGFKKNQYLTYRNGIRIHHAYAFRPNPKHVHSKRQHLFVLRTADLAEYIFQSSDAQQVQEWIDAINYVAASFSAPPLPAPVGSRATGFHKAILPSQASRLDVHSQLREHEQRIVELTTQLQQLNADAPPRTAKGHVVQEYFYRQRYIEEERQRYTAYVQLLSKRLEEAQRKSTVNGTVPTIEEHPPHIPSLELSNDDDGEPSTSASSVRGDRRSYREAVDDNAHEFGI